MYIWRKDVRAKPRSWYSRLAACTSKALLTRVGGNSSVTCSTRGSLMACNRVWFTRAQALMRGTAPTALGMSSSPSTVVTVPCCRS